MEKDLKIQRGAFIRQSKNISDTYSIEKKPLATGSYGAVHKCKHILTKELRAVKIIPKYKMASVEEFLNEIDVMKMLDHPNIIRLYEWFEDTSNVYLVMDLCTGGELFDKISEEGNLTERDAASIFKQMIMSLNYCHVKKICHKDLKPENFMFSSKESNSSVKLIDFGLSQLFSDPKIGRSIRMSAKVGTPFYIAPEVIAGDYDEKCDIWSMGVILYILICGAPPFYGANDYEILESVKRGEFEFDLPIWKSISEECQDLVKKMLVKASKRPSAQEVLEHPWVKKMSSSPDSIEMPILYSRRLKVFSAAQKIKKAVLSYLATQLSEKEMEPIKRLFMALDKNGDGILSAEEIAVGLKGKSNGKELQEIIRSMDTDGSGFIDYNEFVAAALGEEVYLNADKLKQAFNMFDKDKSGKIDAKEIQEVIGGELTGEDGAIWNNLIKDADVDGDGQIDFDEFFKMMYTLKESSKY